LVDEDLIKKIMGSRVSNYRVYDKVDIDSPHGIYIYDHAQDKWIFIDIGGEIFIPRKEGVYVIYFDNTKCPACRIYDIHWFPYVKLIGSSLENTYFVIVLCEWFARECRSTSASETFKYYDIHASPTTVLISVRNGKEIDREKVEGINTMDKLADLVENFIKKNNQPRS